VLAIADKPEGLSVAIDILSMRLHSDGSERRRPLREVAETGQELLKRYVFHRRANGTGHEDYELGVIAAAIPEKARKERQLRSCWSVAYLQRLSSMRRLVTISTIS